MLNFYFSYGVVCVSWNVWFSDFQNFFPSVVIGGVWAQTYYVYTDTHICVYITPMCTRVCAHDIHILAHKHTNVCMYIYEYNPLSYLSIHMGIHILYSIHTHIYLRIHTYAHTCLYTHTHPYIGILSITPISISIWVYIVCIYITCVYTVHVYCM